MTKLGTPVPRWAPKFSLGIKPAEEIFHLRSPGTDSLCVQIFRRLALGIPAGSPSGHRAWQTLYAIDSWFLGLSGS